MPRPSFLALLCWLAASTVAGQIPSGAAGEAPLATYRTAVNQRDLASWLAHGPGSADGVDRDQALRSLIWTRSLADEARRLGLDRRPEVRIELLEARGRRAMQTLRRHASASIQVTEEEVAAEAQALEGRVGLPRRVRLRNLFKRFPDGATADQKRSLRQEMEVLRQRVIAGADFAALAAAESESPTRQRGGLIGNLRPGTLRPSVERIALGLGPGEISEVLEESEGLTLLFCEKVLPAVVRTPSEVQEIARKRLENLAWRRDWNAMEAHLLAHARADWRWETLHPEQGSIDPQAPLLQYRGDLLTAAEGRAVLTPGDTFDAMAQRPREQLMRRAESFLRGQMAVREVVALGLDTEAMAQRAAWTAERILASKALAEMVARRLTPPSDAEADALVAAEPERFLRPEDLDLRLIALPFDAADPRPAYALARRLEAQLLSGEATFDALARKHSAHPSADQGGDVPNIPRHAVGGRLGIDAARALRPLQPGQRSGWTQDDERQLLWLIELQAVQPERPLDPRAARDAAQRILGQQKAEALASDISQEWMEGLDLRLSPSTDLPQ